MKWFVGVLLALAMAMPPLLANEPELPSRGGEGAMEIEPPLLLPNRSIDEFLALAGANKTTATPPPSPDLDKLEKDLARARTRAGSGDRLYRAGIIAKIDAEERVLRVVRLEAQLAEAQLAHAKQQTEGESDNTVEINDNPAPSPVRALVAEAAAAAQRAAAEQHRAELEAAAINLKRQQKLLALGSGRKAEVSRAQKRLADLQQPKE